MHRLSSAGPTPVTVYSLGIMTPGATRKTYRQASGWLYVGIALVTVYAAWMVGTLVGVLVS